MIGQEFSCLQRTAADSRLGRIISAQLRLVAEGWRDSIAGGVLSRGSQDVSAWPMADRLRACALVVGWGALGHWGLLFVVPPYVAPGIPKVVFFALSLLAFGAAAAAPQITTAWVQSTLGRVTTGRSSPQPSRADRD